MSHHARIGVRQSYKRRTTTTSARVHECTAGRAALVIFQTFPHSNHSSFPCTQILSMQHRRHLKEESHVHKFDCGLANRHVCVSERTLARAAGGIAQRSLAVAGTRTVSKNCVASETSLSKRKTRLGGMRYCKTQTVRMYNGV